MRNCTLKKPMLNRYIDLINSSTEKNTEYDDRSTDISFDTSIDSEISSQSDYYSTFMAKYRKKLKSLMSSSPEDESSLFSSETNYESNSSFSKNNQIYQLSKTNPRKSYGKTSSPSTSLRNQKTQINFRTTKSEINNSPFAYEKNEAYSPLKRQIQIERNGKRRKRRKIRDFLSFDPVFNKYFYGDKISSSDDDYYDYYDYYEYYDDDQENSKNNTQSKIEDVDDDLIDSNSINLNSESEDFSWIESEKVRTKKPRKNCRNVNIWQPNLASPTISNKRKK